MREVPVELRAISKRYGGFEAVKSVSFSLMEGELCALIGENGAGQEHVNSIDHGAFGAIVRNDLDVWANRET